MDPLSISASVLTLISAGGTLSKLLRKGIGLKNAPDVLRALYDEISELQSTADDVDDLLLRTASGDPDDRPPKSLIGSLTRVKSTLLQLESCISYQLTTITADGESVRLDKSVYLRAEGRLRELKDEIQTSRIALASALSLFASSIGLQNRNQSRQISCSLKLLHNKFELVPALSRHVLDIPQMISVPQSSYRTIGAMRESIESRHGVSAKRKDPLHRASIDLQDKGHPKNASTVQLIPNCCNAGCRCPCHSNNKIRSPKFLHIILGSLFLNYRAYPSFDQACGVQCRARAGGIACVYAFPPWLLERAISISYSCALAKGPELLLRVMRRRDFEIINALLTRRQSHALKEMKCMLDRGETSVLDIDKYGYTILHKVVYRRKWNLAHMLISYGADINYVNQEEKCPTSPFIDAWSRRWEQRLRQSDIPKNWDDLFFQDITHFDSFGFVSLHKAYLGLGGLTFDQVLASTERSDVDESDYQGRKVLSWAAARGDSETVGKLLACDAHPDKQCNMNRSPVHFAASVDVRTTGLLLNAKADVNATNEWGAIPLHYVTSRTRSLVKRMVDLGADIEKREVSGQTPLSFSCRYGQALAAKELLACGADINVRNSNDSTPILLALMYNHHQTISILLSNPSLRFQADRRSMSDFFAQVAVYSDTKTFLILKDQWPISTSFEERFDVREALEWAQSRRDYNASWSQRWMRPRDENPIGWHETFKEMMDKIVERSQQASGPEDEIWEDARERPEDLSLAVHGTRSA